MGLFFKSAVDGDCVVEHNGCCFNVGASDLVVVEQNFNRVIPCAADDFAVTAYNYFNGGVCVADCCVFG